MSSSLSAAPRSSLLAAFQVQCRVIGALILREMHTRFGRDNIGYLWMIGEPLMFGSVIALMHSAQSSEPGGINAVAFTVTGYSIFVTFRSIVGRSDGAYEGNTPLLYHRMVTMFDVCVARGLLELAGSVLAFMVLMTAIIMMGIATFPVRPLWLLLGILYIFWLSMSLSLIIVSITYENPLVERFVHPFTYFMIPLSGAFYRVEWIPEPYRSVIGWIPFPGMFEMCRYGQFEATSLEFVYLPYMTGCLLVLTLLGLLMLSTSRSRIHLK